MKQRLQKVLASAGVGSRRRAEQIIAAGLVEVNGLTAHVGDTVDSEVDQIHVRGKPLTTSTRLLYVALNKPVGFVTSTRRFPGERSVLDLLDSEQRVLPVGRLDKDSSGLLLFTNDGDWANLVMHPRYGIEKEYEVVVRGHATRQNLDRLAGGVELPDGSRTAPLRVRPIGSRGKDTVVSITLLEGKKRQIRHMCAAIGHPVVELKRVRVGRILLGTLVPGASRHLSPDEVDSMRELPEIASRVDHE